MKYWSLFLSLIFSLVLVSQSVYADDPLPPTELIEWLDYALKKYPPQDCPQFEGGVKKCAAISKVSFRGDLQSGKVEVELTGYNWSRTDQSVTLLGPSSKFSLQNHRITLEDTFDPDINESVFMAPYFDSAGAPWKITIPPGQFRLVADLLFNPEGVLPMSLARDVGYVSVNELKGGFVQFDDNLGKHGGELQFVLEGQKQDVEERPQVRVYRVFEWGSIPTFRYQIQVLGLRDEAPVEVPLLSDEVIEKVHPDKPYSIVERDGIRYFQATFSGVQKSLILSGHYKKVPNEFRMSKVLPFEIWIHLSDRRYPVNIDTNSNPIDPSEFSDLVSPDNAKAFMVKPGEKIAFRPIALTVDEGRKGKGKIQLNAYEGFQGYWLEKMFLRAKIAGQDRLVIPTPQPAIYAGIDEEGIELFHDEKNQLSVRLPTSGLQDQKPIEVDWSVNRDTPWFFQIFTATLPAQNVYLEQVDVDAYFQPGRIPLLAWGLESSTGDILDQFHLYGFLIGILVFFICRGLKFEVPLSLLVSFLFIGLYRVNDFPTSAVLFILSVSLPLVRMPDHFLHKLKSWKVRSKLVQLTWVFFFVITIVPLTNYGRDRVFDALHPYADQNVIRQYDSNKYDSYSGGRGNRSLSKSRPMVKKAMSTIAPTAEPVMEDEGVFEFGGSSGNIPQQQQIYKYRKEPLSKVQEWNAKPVSLDAFTSGGNVVKGKIHNVNSGQSVRLNVLVAGPVVRGIWMLLETGLILWMVAALLLRVRRVYV